MFQSNCVSLLAIVICFAALPGAADAEVVSITSTKAAGLYESADGALANGAGAYMFAGRTNQPPGLGTRRALVWFDLLPTVPADATINSATLSLYLSRSAEPNTPVLNLHRVLGTWSEGASNAEGQEGDGAPAETGDVTWVHRSYNNALWGIEGGDIARGSSATASVGTTQRYYNWTSTELADDVRSWLTEPASNTGWILLGDESAFQTAKRFNTDDHPDPTRRPRLTIDFTPIPEPAFATAAMLAILIGCRRPAPRSRTQC